MLVTEEEAKTKWCPEAHIGGTLNETTTANRWTQVIPDGRAVEAGGGCIGSACMAWRWNDAAVQTVETATGQVPAGAGWMQVDQSNYSGVRWSRPINQRHGFCGKAGPTRM